MSARDLSLIPRGVPSEGEIRRRPEETETVQQFFYTASVEFILSGFLFPLLILWFLFEQVAALAFWASRTGDILLAPVLGAFPLLVFVYYLTFQIVVSSVYAWHRWSLKASIEGKGVLWYWSKGEGGEYNGKWEILAGVWERNDIERGTAVKEEAGARFEWEGTGRGGPKYSEGTGFTGSVKEFWES
uniref:Uncharacterized protein n=1 Tax=Chromera velia CCMP2878 TaxID=1169474 RepID=A0A0G4F5S1_9ALVE|eukprot:Cvel_15321.t1-p1 / transcript=Cvel_15321.t1 / gene=Cvel_15321 / organism=Chromera_velia_CCMP2878 / gene_product=hypothetical protein / transcript_product=hypothetical protein / location=Cvel_scaffold1127:7666-12126(-) / protein_length=186 / sequence_SO=supercontig / SO=protein_coding / is_pseudo=false